VKPREIKVCIMRVGGTNCDNETMQAFQSMGVHAVTVHQNELLKKHNLLDYDMLVFPGGFSYGDYVRAGAIWAKWILTKLGNDLKAFAKEERPILGICNGFQVLVEAGLLPGFEGISAYPEATLATNIPPGYNCRWIHLKNENNGKCVFTKGVPKGKILHVPVAHSEGRFMFAKEIEKRNLRKLCDNDQLVFRYCFENGEYPLGCFPANPNGSFSDIAGICSDNGKIFGLMPHPERAFYWWQQPDWTQHEIGRDTSELQSRIR
jgi:phosphoribosylformylglycinamidine synthase I